MRLVDWLRIPIFCVCVFLPTLGFSAPDEEMLVAAAVSLQDALQDVAQAFKDATPDAPQVRFNFGASSTLARQITMGAPVDAFIAADSITMDGLAAKNLVVARRDIVANELVLITRLPQGVVDAPRDLTKKEVHHVALAPTEVPIGHYGLILLERLSLAQVLKAKLVRPEHARATLAMVARGVAEAGFVYASDIRAASGIRKVYTADQIDIRYPAAVTTRSAKVLSARRFLDFLTAPAAQEIFRKHGFVQVH